MNVGQPHILIIDDDANINRALLRVLHKDFFVATTTSIKEGLNIIKQSRPFLAIVDLKMPEASGIEVLKEIKRIEPEIEVIIMSAYDEIKSVIEACKCGATDFITKPFENGVLLEKVKRLATIKCFERKSLLPQVKGIVGESPAIKHVWELIKRFASSDITILLQGETGTGKELFANVIHCMSLRNREPFVPVDCSAFPESLLESELFGYEKDYLSRPITVRSFWTK
jgi:DNA-binding NtrC family response regulator